MQVMDYHRDHRIPNFEQWATAERVVVAEYFWDRNHTEHEKSGLLPSGQVIKGRFPGHPDRQEGLMRTPPGDGPR